MSRKIESWVFSIFAISMVVFAFAPPVIYWNKCELFALDAGPCIAQFVDRFQTLITGLAAVIGAFFTVRAMHLTDQESDRRHNQLMGLSLRADALKIDRFFKDRYPKLIESIAVVQGFSQIRVPDFETQECYEEFVNAKNQIVRSVYAIKATCSPEVIGGVEPFLSGDVTQIIEELADREFKLSDAISAASLKSGDIFKKIKEIKKYNNGDFIFISNPNALEKMSADCDASTQELISDLNKIIVLVDDFLRAAEALSNALLALHSRYVPYMD